MNKTLLSLLLSFLVLVSSSYSQERLNDTIEIEEVVVTGSKIEIARKNVALTVSVINRDELESTSESALLPVISEQVPGLFVTERGVTGFGVAEGAAGQINMRGLGGNPTTQVLILIDGHPQFMGMMGHHLPDAYVTSDAERVEVLRGPASVLYGSNAFGGAINIITRKQGKEGASARARVQYGSYNTQKYMGSAGYRKKKFSVFASLNHDRTEGHRDSSDFSIVNAYLKTGYELSPAFNVTADVSIANYETRDPGPENGPAGDRIDILRGKTALSLENEFKHVKGTIRAYYNFGEHTISDGWHSRDEMSGFMFHQALSLLPGNTLTLGYDYMQYGGKGSPISTVLRDEEGNVIMPPQFQLSPVNDSWIVMDHNAFYAFIQQYLTGGLMLNGGIRYELNNTYGKEWIPQLGLAWNIGTGTTIKTSLSKGYRPPSIRELYLFPPANERLMPERMVNFEAGWLQHWMNHRMKTELTGFIARGQNLIIMVPPVPPPPPTYRNSGTFLNRGIEFSCSYQPSDQIKLHTNYTFIDMKNPLPATPVHNLFMSATYRIKKLTLQMKLQNIFKLVNDTGNGSYEVIEQSYHLLGTGVSYRFNKLIDVFFHANNLLNQKYQINKGYPMPGITVFGGLNLRLDSE